MQLTELIREDLVKIGMEAQNKWEAIEELVDLLISVHELSLMDRSEVLEAVFTRERSVTTGLEHGLAIPHGAARRIEDVVAAMGTSQEGIPFESMDGQPAKLVILLLIPQGTFQKHVRTLAGIAKLGSTPSLRERIFQADTTAEVMAVLRESDAMDHEE